MHADEILDLMRPAVLVIDGGGTIEQVHGGHGGFFGIDLDTVVGSSVFDHVAPEDVDQLAVYFLESIGETKETVARVMPFRVTMIGGDGCLHPVDVLPSSNEPGSESMTWVVLVMPISLSTSVSMPLEAEMERRPRSEVKRLLSQELASSLDESSREVVLIELDGRAPTVITSSCDSDGRLTSLICREVNEGWQPWTRSDGSFIDIAPDDLPSTLADLARERHWRHLTCCPVFVGGTLRAVYLYIASDPDSSGPTGIKSNVRARLAQLVSVTALIFGRWDHQQRLVHAATRDSLTGLANRDAFHDALAETTGPVSVLYIDVDFFKSVNDRHGHDIGDRVLVHVSARITAACRPDDLVARMGGDEFVVLLPSTDPATSALIGERIIELISEPLDLDTGPDAVTVSIGLAHADAADDAVDAADRAMLQAKRQGRSRLVSA